jgi:hypothetical protein
MKGLIPSKIRAFFAWYDFWIGFYWRKENRTLYICPLPMLVIALTFERTWLSEASVAKSWEKVRAADRVVGIAPEGKILKAHKDEHGNTVIDDAEITGFSVVPGRNLTDPDCRIH